MAAYQAAQEHTQANGLDNHWDQRFHFMDYLLYAYLQMGQIEKARQVVERVQAINNAQPQNTTLETFAK